MFKYVRYTPFTDEYTTHSFNSLNEKCKIHSFDVPCVSIECEVLADFTELMAAQNTLINAVVITDIEFKDATKNSSQVERIYAVANDQFEVDMALISTKYSQVEISTWPTQIDDARSHLKGELIEAPILEALALEDGITLTEAADLLIFKRTDYSRLTAWALTRKWDKVRELKFEVGL